MHLNEAIILGDSLRQRSPGKWLDNSSTCGCALGGALMATGKDKDFLESGQKIDFIQKEWPFLTWGYINMISIMFADVCQGVFTIEDLADYVKTIESKADVGFVDKDTIVTVEEPELVTV